MRCIVMLRNTVQYLYMAWIGWIVRQIRTDPRDGDSVPTRMLQLGGNRKGMPNFGHHAGESGMGPGSFHFVSSLN